jgi:hypothetical protein
MRASSCGGLSSPFYRGRWPTKRWIRINLVIARGRGDRRPLSGLRDLVRARSANLPSAGHQDNFGGINARRGFLVQDHVAGSWCSRMSEDASLAEVLCETLDDITLYRDSDLSSTSETRPSESCARSRRTRRRDFDTLRAIVRQSCSAFGLWQQPGKALRDRSSHQPAKPSHLTCPATKIQENQKRKGSVKNPDYKSRNSLANPLLFLPEV